MFDQLLSVFGLGQAAFHRAEDRKLRVLARLSEIEATVMEASLSLGFEIKRLEMLASAANVDPDMAVAGLKVMLGQCNDLNATVHTNRTLAQSKGANELVVSEVDRWAATCSVMPAQITQSVRQIELAISLDAQQ